jgi:hypothetical protein
MVCEVVSGCVRPNDEPAVGGKTPKNTPKATGV